MPSGKLFYDLWPCHICPPGGRGHPNMEKEGAAEKAFGRVGGWGGRLTGARLPPKVSKANDGEEQSLWGAESLAGRAGWPVSCPRFPRPVLVSPTYSQMKLSQWHPWACLSLALS